MNLPNKITLLRIALIPLFIVILYLPLDYKHYLAAGIFVLISLTDLLDGYIARKRNQVTTLGKFIDPLADKLLVAAALIFLIGCCIEAWMVFVIIARDFIVIGLRFAALSHNKVIHASNLAKIKTFSQIVAVVGVLLSPTIGWWLMLIAVILTVISGIDYFAAARKYLE